MRFLFILLFFPSLAARAQDSTCIKVHFLYGSRPLHQYKDVEPKWFGGVLGGHVGIEGDSGRILDFVRQSSFHWFARKRNRHSCYAIHTEQGFYAILGANPDSVKKLVITIPISALQKQRLDSIGAAYRQQTPYDYALVGMRCGAAAYDILSRLGILPAYSYRTTYLKILYPKKLRRRLLALAKTNGWPLRRQEGTGRRKWEKD